MLWVSTELLVMIISLLSFRVGAKEPAIGRCTGSAISWKWMQSGIEPDLANEFGE